MVKWIQGDGILGPRGTVFWILSHYICACFVKLWELQKILRGETNTILIRKLLFNDILYYTDKLTKKKLSTNISVFIWVGGGGGWRKGEIGQRPYLRIVLLFETFPNLPTSTLHFLSFLELMFRYCKKLSFYFTLRA